MFTYVYQWIHDRPSFWLNLPTSGTGPVSYQLVDINVVNSNELQLYHDHDPPQILYPP